MLGKFLVINVPSAGAHREACACMRTNKKTPIGFIPYNTSTKGIAAKQGSVNGGVVASKYGMQLEILKKCHKHQCGSDGKSPSTF